MSIQKETIYASCTLALIFFARSASAQLGPVDSATQTEQRPILFNTTDSCKPGPASSVGMPVWNEVEANNRAYFKFLGSSQAPKPYPASAPVVGVPNLDDPAANLTTGESIQNILSLFSNAIDVIKAAGQVTSPAAGSDKVGVGICKQSGGTSARALITPARSYCDYVAECASHGKSTFLWIPEDLDFLHNLSVKTKYTGVVNLWDQAADFDFDFPKASDEPKKLEKWTFKLVKVIDKWTAAKRDGFFANFASGLKSVENKYNKWWKSFTKRANQVEASVNRYVEGYHLGAYDDMRPDLHMCVGYYGHNTDNIAAGIFGGRITIGSNYNSFNLSKNLRAQMRRGGMELKFINKKTGAESGLSLLATPEFNLQYDGLKSWNCDSPFGSGISLCPTAPIGLPNVSSTNQCRTTNYLSFQNLGEGNNTFQIGAMKDFYPISLDGKVVWPREPRLFMPIGGQQSPWNADNIMASELPSTAVMSAGLNLGFDFGLSDPAPKVLTRFQIGPVPAVLRWDLNYGLRWVHDSNFMLAKIEEGLQNSGSSYPVASLLERSMHPLQADDLTADNGQDLYVKPSLYLGAGISIGKPRWGLELLLDMGLHVDVEPGFYAGIADMSVAMQETLEKISDMEGECKPVYGDSVSTSNTCSADIYAYEDAQGNVENSIVARTLKKLNTGKLLNKEDILYYCGTKPALDPKTQGTPTYMACADRGYCVNTEGKRTKHNVTADACDEYDPKASKFQVYERFIRYSCSDHKKTQIVGWEGPGCSPLLKGAGFPSAPGGICKPPFTTVTSTFTPMIINPDGTTSLGAPTQQEIIRPQDVCTAGTACEEGACLTQCTGDAGCDNGLTCNTSKGVCTNPNGVPFVEQIAWRKDNPVPGEPQHSVWSHAINKLEAKVDFSLGYSIKAWVKVFKKQYELINKRDSKYWNLASKGWLDYEIGMSAQYDNSCSPDVGKVEVNQNLPRISDGQFNSSSELVDACLAGMPDDVLPPEGPPCLNGESPNGDGMCGLPDDDNISDGIESGLEWSEEFALGMWDEFEGQMCINDTPWQEWVAQTTSEDGLSDSGVAVFASGNKIGTLSENGRASADLERNIANASGCLKVRNSFGAAIAANSGVDSQGNIRVFDNLIDPDLPATPDNIQPSFKLPAQFSIWYDQTDQCLADYIEGRGDRPGQVTLGLDMRPCPGVQAISIDLKNPNSVNNTKQDIRTYSPQTENGQELPVNPESIIKGKINPKTVFPGKRKPRKHQ